MNGVLIIHGFGGDRTEINPLAEFLSNKGYIVKTPVLKGHECSCKELAKATYTDWLLDAENAYTELSKHCSEITVIGFSMGGLIAVNLYQIYRFNKLITINTPIYYWNFKLIFRNLKRNFKLYFRHYFNAVTSKPIRALWQFQCLLNKSKSLFKTIRCESLVIQIQDDDTVNSKSGDYIFKKIQGEKEIIKPLIGGHVVFKSEYYNNILIKILDFIS